LDVGLLLAVEPDTDTFLQKVLVVVRAPGIGREPVGQGWVHHAHLTAAPCGSRRRAVWSRRSACGSARSAWQAEHTPWDRPVVAETAPAHRGSSAPRPTGPSSSA